MLPAVAGELHAQARQLAYTVEVEVEAVCERALVVRDELRKERVENPPSCFFRQPVLQQALDEHGLRQVVAVRLRPAPA